MDWGSFFGGAAKMGMFNDELEEKRRERAQRDAQFQQSYTLQQNADQRAATESEYQNMVRSAHTAHQKKYQDILSRINSGNMEDVPQLISAYNRNQGALKDDHTIHMMPGLGGKQMASVRGPDGKVVSEHEMTPQTIRQAIMSMAAMEAAALPGADMGKFYQSERDHGLKVDELGMKRGYYKSEENKNNVQAEWMPKLNQSTINYQSALGHAAGLRAEHSGGSGTAGLSKDEQVQAQNFLGSYQNAKTDTERMKIAQDYQFWKDSLVIKRGNLPNGMVAPQKLHGLNGEDPFADQRKAILEGKLTLSVPDPKDPKQRVQLDQSQSLQVLEQQSAIRKATQAALSEFNTDAATMGRGNAVAKHGSAIQNAIKDPAQRLAAYAQLGMTEKEIAAIEPRANTNVGLSARSVGSNVRQGVLDYQNNTLVDRAGRGASALGQSIGSFYGGLTGKP